jgi:hypothetical protein
LFSFSAKPAIGRVSRWARVSFTTWLFRLEIGGVPKTESKSIASKIIQHPAVTIERIKRRRIIFEFSV